MSPLNLQNNVYTFSIIKNRLNGIKGISKIQNRESLFKHQSHFYNVQRKNNVNHRGMKLLQNKKLFPLLNFINGKPAAYGSNVILRH